MQNCSLTSPGLKPHIGFLLFVKHTCCVLPVCLSDSQEVPILFKFNFCPLVFLPYKQNDNHKVNGIWGGIENVERQRV